MAKKFIKKIGFAAIVASLSMLSLAGCKKTTPVDNPNVGKDTTIVTPPVQEFSIEKQWMIPGDIEISMPGITLKGKALIDISVTKQGYFIAAMQQAELAKDFGIPEDSYWYTEDSPVIIKKTDGRSGTITFTTKDDDDNIVEKTLIYTNLTENTVILKDDEETIEVTAAPQKIELIKIEE